ncbi:metallophosphoesterase [Alicyclobacillus tolerans]|uniref:metallophosphoesterase family protein n=1 Tax=Alicyclobacillus tolerans TaxID=90970 RepID=UPI001F1DB7BE|nr:metallophosphoesterase [Alicyclobacillus tolerans]MCF8565509.1 metallophosphoesterase [Alicyclobacillus tolerans]
MRNLKIYFTTDIHGSEKCFRKFLNAGAYYRADVIILGGDITGKIVVPIVSQGNGKFVATFHGDTIHCGTQQDLLELERQIKYAGYYPYRCDPDELQYLRDHKNASDEMINRMMIQSVTEWMELAESKLRGTGIRCFISPGNDDVLELDAILSSSDYVECPDARIVDLDGYEMLSYGWVNVTPWNSPRDLPDDELAKRIQSLAAELKNPNRAIFNLHVPPYNSGLDTAPVLDSELKPVVAGGEVQTAAVGSQAVRSLIEQYQPILSLHGHIHESRGATRIGRCVSLNPGSEYGEGLLHGAVVTVTPKGVKNHILVIN